MKRLTNALPFGALQNRTQEVAGLLLYYGLLLVVILAAVWPFRSVLGFYFTKMETGFRLHEARVSSLHDLQEIFTHPTLRSFTDYMYYRPIHTLSFSLDYALWGLTPFGYHLTDLVLHAAVAGLLFRIVYLLNDRDLAAGALAGLCYTLHPVLIDVVPANVLRNETLSACFGLIGLWAFYRYEYQEGGPISLAGALAGFVLAVGSKEIGAIFFLLAVLYLLIVPPAPVSSMRDRLRETLRRGWPYLLTVALYVTWWAYVTRARAFLGGGGIFLPPIFQGSWSMVLYQQLYVFPTRILPFHFHALLSPFEGLYGTVGSLLDPGSLTAFSGTARLTSGLLTLLVGTWTLRALRSLTREVSLSTLSRALLGGVLVALVAFPLYAPLLDALVTRAYHTGRPNLLAALMDSQHRYSPADYHWKARSRLVMGLGGLGLLLAGLALIMHVRRVRSSLRTLHSKLLTGLSVLGEVLQHPRLLLFYTAWLLVPALFYSVTRRKWSWITYSMILPFSALLGTLLADSARRLGRDAARFWHSSPAPSRRTVLRGGLALLLTIVCLGHLGLLVRHAPLGHPLSKWEDVQEVSRLYHGVLRHELSRLPADSTIYLQGNPLGRIANIFKESSPPYFAGLRPDPWIQMWFPEHNFDLRTSFFDKPLRPCPCHLWLEKDQPGPRTFRFVTHASRQDKTIKYTTTPPGKSRK